VHRAIHDVYQPSLVPLIPSFYWEDQLLWDIGRLQFNVLKVSIYLWTFQFFVLPQFSKINSSIRSKNTIENIYLKFLISLSMF